MLAKSKRYYYSLKLTELLNASFPELSGNKVFVARRVQKALGVYNDAFMAKNSSQHCSEIAEYVLFEGLCFSKFETVVKVVCSELDVKMDYKELRLFSLKMLTVCSAVFEQYQLWDGFADTNEYHLLYAKLSNTIKNWAQENGMY